MDENAVTALLLEATDEVAERGFDPADDLRRGRTARRRRRNAATAAALLGTAAAVAVAFLLSAQLADRPEATEVPAGGPQIVTTTATSSASAISASSTMAPTTSTGTIPAAPTTTADLFGLPAGAEQFNRLLFGVAQDHMDPDHTRLEWSVGFTGSGADATKEWGQKFGWQIPGERGQAMVYPGVGNIPAANRLPCGRYDPQVSRKCTTTVLPNGQKAEVVDSATHREVHWNRPDGTYVFVIVDAVFRNKTTVATKAPLPTLAQLKDFVTDPRLVLPPA
jgi:hypothetical protein